MEINFYDQGVTWRFLCECTFICLINLSQFDKSLDHIVFKKILSQVRDMDHRMDSSVTMTVDRLV